MFPRRWELFHPSLAHELIHWTKHPSRLGRDFGRKQWGDEGYAQEELVAELGAAFLRAQLELGAEPREENASSIANWLSSEERYRFIFKAAATAVGDPKLAPPEAPAPPG